MQDRDKIILLQNLLNRATEIELHNAAFEKRKADVIQVNELLKNAIKIFQARIKDFK